MINFQKFINENINEAKPAGLSKKETLKVAQKFAKALTKLDGMKYTVNSDYEEDSFDLDIEDQDDVDPRTTGEYAGGSYNINADGSVVNMAVWNKKNVSPVYGNMDDDINTIIKTIKNLKESVVTEARYNKKSLLKKLGDADDATIQTGNGKEYIIYNPDSNNDDNAAMWNDDSVFAVDQDGEEHEIAYKDIGLVMVESVANEAFSRMSNDAIGNELYSASQALTTYYDWLKAGNDAGNGKSIDHIISLLKKCKSSIKRFNDKEETIGTEYEAPALESVTNESKITLKRRYTENHPAKTAGKFAKVRNKVLEAIADGTITQEEFDNILSELSNNAKRWSKNNSKYFTISEEGISLSKFGKRVLNSITINEATTENPEIWVPSGFDKAIAKLPNSQITRDVVLKVAKKHKVNPDDAIAYVEYGWMLDLNESTNKNMKTQFIYESFSEFANSLNESTETLNEAKSAKVTKKEWPYVEFKVGGKLHKVEFDYEDIIDDHGNEGQDQYWLGKDDDGKEWSIDVYADYNGNVEEVHYDTIVAESVINEAFKSSKLRNLLTMSDAMGWGKNSTELPKAFYQLTKMKLDQIGDEDLLDITPKEAYKTYSKNRDAVVFYVVDNDKANPFGEGSLKPGLLGLTRGKDFLGVQYEKSGRRDVSKKTLKGGDDRMAVGGNKAYRGYDATGIYNIKRAADLADRAIVFSLVNNSKSSREDIKSRIEAKEGAIAFKSHADFKKANLARYSEILANKASKLPLDKMVEDAINLLTAQLQAAIKSGEKTQYGEIKVGQNSRGRDVKVTDVSNHMNSILRDYERYVSDIVNAEKEKESGYSSSYYEGSSKKYAKSVKDSINKIKKFDYAW